MARKQKATKVVKVLKKKEEELTEERKQELTNLVADQVNKESQFLDSLDILLKVK